VSDPAGPIGSGDRAPALDALRGFALLGILLVNLRLFSAPLSFDPGLGPGAPWWDRLAAGAVTVLAEGRFYPLFSFLLGYGFTVAHRRAWSRGASYTDRHLRRSAALFVLGALHAALLFSGDILSAYAVLGLGLLAAVHWRDRSVLTLSGVLLGLGALVYGGFGALAAAMATDPAVGGDFARDAQLYEAGSFAEVAALRLGDWGLALLTLPVTGPTVAAAMLLGHWAARRRLLEDPGAHRGLLRRLVVLGLPLGLAGGVVHALTLSRFGSTGTAGMGPLAVTGVLNHVAGALLTGAYVGIAGLVAARRGPAWRGTPLQAVGRLALSNYLGQSLVCSLVFAGYGLGLYGRLGRAQVVAFGVALWVVQVALSAGYLRVFVMGPVEWLLRWVTYRRRPVLRRTA
jgi:uncharacterized protein